MLGGRFRDPDALQADMQTGIIHHGEHAGHAAIFRPYQPSATPTRLAKSHDTCRAGMDAQLFFQTDALHIVGCA